MGIEHLVGEKDKVHKEKPEEEEKMRRGEHRRDGSNNYNSYGLAAPCTGQRTRRC